MTSINNPESLYSKISRRAAATIDPYDRPDITFFKDQLHKFNGKLESRLYYFLNPKSANLFPKLLYAIPINFFINNLPAIPSATISFLGIAYLQYCKEEHITKKSKITLLQSIAIAFFANLCNHSTGYSQDGLIKLSLNGALMAGSLLAANRLER